MLGKEETSGFAAGAAKQGWGAPASPLGCLPDRGLAEVRFPVKILQKARKI